MHAGHQSRRSVGRSIGRKFPGKANIDFLLVVGMLLGWFALQAFVLPGLGVST